MIVAHRLADDLGTLAVAPVGRKPELAHGIKDAPVHRFEAVTYVGQRPVHDGGERVGEVALLEGILELDSLDGAGRGWNRRLGHALA